MEELELIDELITHKMCSEDWMYDFLDSLQVFYAERRFLSEKQKEAVHNIYDHCTMVDNIAGSQF